jgi:hypothetical protein
MRQLQVIVTTWSSGVGLESWTVTWVTRGIGAAANPVTEKPQPEAGTTAGAIVPTVPGTEKNTLYGGVPPVTTKFDTGVAHDKGGAGGAGDV